MAKDSDQLKNSGQWLKLAKAFTNKIKRITYLYVNPKNPCKSARTYKGFSVLMQSQEEKFESLIEGIIANGYGVCDDFLSSEEVAMLNARFSERFDNGNFKDASIGKQSEVHQATEIRGDKILWLESNSVDSSERILLDKNQAFINYLNQTCYLGIIDAEIHFAKYDIGKFYRRHRDTFQAQKGRILSVIYYLNSNWLPENGGNLLIYTQENNIEKIISIAPLAGRLVCFQSEKLDHEVSETFRERLSITGWLLNC